jgi:hypothetical protein
MRHPIRASIVFASALLGAAMLAPQSAHSQQKPNQPPAATQQPAAPPIAPVKPYKVVNVTPAAPFADPSLEAFRKQLTDIAKRKDRAALAKLVAQDFFWETDSGDKADKKKPGIDNLAAAIGLDGKEGVGWDVLSGLSSDPSASPVPERKGVVCSPADPQFDEKELEDLIKSSQTDPSEWAFPASGGLEVRGAAQPSAPAIEKLGMHFIRVLPEQTSPAAQSQVPMLKIVTPSGKTGFLSADALAPLGSDQICYVKDASGWKITGYAGGGEQ